MQELQNEQDKSANSADRTASALMPTLSEMCRSPREASTQSRQDALPSLPNADHFRDFINACSPADLKYTAPSMSDADRQKAAQELLSELANPQSIEQGKAGNTCTGMKVHERNKSNDSSNDRSIPASSGDRSNVMKDTLAAMANSRTIGQEKPENTCTGMKVHERNETADQLQRSIEATKSSHIDKVNDVADKATLTDAWKNVPQMNRSH